MTVDTQRLQKAISVFNECLYAETSNTLNTYWNPEEYIPAFITTIGVVLPDPSDLRTALDALLDTHDEQDVKEFRAAFTALWTLIYGESQP